MYFTRIILAFLLSKRPVYTGFENILERNFENESKMQKGKTQYAKTVQRERNTVQEQMQSKMLTAHLQQSANSTQTRIRL